MENERRPSGDAWRSTAVHGDARRCTGTFAESGLSCGFGARTAKVQRIGFFTRLEGELFSRLLIDSTAIEIRAERLPDGRGPLRTMWL